MYIALASTPPRRRGLAAVVAIVMLMAPALPLLPTAEANHPNGSFDSGDLTGWSMTGTSHTLNEPTGSQSRVAWARDVSPAYAFGSPQGLRLYCYESGLPERRPLHWWCYSGVQTTFTHGTSVELDFNLRRPVKTYWAADLQVIVSDGTGSIKWVYDSDPNNRACDVGTGVTCVPLPSYQWHNKCMDVGARFEEVHGRAIQHPYTVRVTTYSDQTSSEVWVDNVRHGTCGSGPAAHLPLDPAVITPSFQNAHPEPYGGGSCASTPRNVYGFTTDTRPRSGSSCGTGELDRPHALGASIPFNVNMGEMAAYQDFATRETYRLALDATINYAPGNPIPSDVKAGRVYVNDRHVGDLHARTVNGQPTACLQPVLVAGGCGPSLPMPATTGASTWRPAWTGSPVVQQGNNNVRVDVIDSAATRGVITTVSVNAGAIELAAPPMFIIHGWVNAKRSHIPSETSLECQAGPSTVGDRNDRGWPGESWRVELAASFRAQAVAAMGQDPWDYTIDNDGGINDGWSYCGTRDWAWVSGRLAERMAELKGHYDGEVWLTAHSMGGLVSRHYFEVVSRGDHPVTRLATMGTPHRGSCLAVYSGALTSIVSVIKNPGNTVFDLMDQVEYAHNHAADYTLHWANPTTLAMNALPRSSQTDYLSLAGLKPLTGGWLCDDAYRSTYGDGAVPDYSSKFKGGHGGAKSFEVVEEWCFGHGDYYNTKFDEQGRKDMAEWYFRPDAQGPTSRSSLSDCFPLKQVEAVVEIGGKVYHKVRDTATDTVVWIAVETLKAKDKAVGIWDDTTDLASDIWDGTVRGLRNAHTWRCYVCVFGLDAEPQEAERLVTLSGGNATFILMTPAEDDRFTLELVAPDGTVIGDGDASETTARLRFESEAGHELHWYMQTPAAGEWRVRVRGPADATEPVPFFLFVQEDESPDFAIATDGTHYEEGEVPQLTADLEAPAGTTVTAVTATGEDDFGTFTFDLTGTDGLYAADVPVRTRGAVSLVVKATGTFADGRAFVARAQTELVVLRDVDWELRDFTLDQAHAWRGAPVTATANVCNVGLDAAPGGADLVVRQGTLGVSSVPIEIPTAGACVPTTLTWSAIANGATTVAAEIMPKVQETGDAPNTASAPLTVHAAPTTVATLDGPAGLNGWFTGPVTATLAPFDNTPSVFPIEVAVDDAAFTPYAGALAFPTDGVFTLRYRAFDPVSGQNEPTKTTIVKVDQTAPVPRLDADGGFVAADGATWVAPETTLTAAASDATSGVATVTYTVDTAESRAAEPFRLVDADGVRSVTVDTTDAAGNAATATFAARVDSTAPDVIILDPASGAVAKDDARAGGDADNDGVPDSVEVTHGTDPRDPVSVPGTRDVATNGAFAHGASGWTVFGGLTPSVAADEDSPLAWATSAAVATGPTLGAPSGPDCAAVPPEAPPEAGDVCDDPPPSPPTPPNVEATPCAAAPPEAGPCPAGAPAAGSGVLVLSGADATGVLAQDAPGDHGASAFAGVTFDTLPRHPGTTFTVTAQYATAQGDTVAFVAEATAPERAWSRIALPASAFDAVIAPPAKRGLADDATPVVEETVGPYADGIVAYMESLSGYTDGVTSYADGLVAYADDASAAAGATAEAAASTAAQAAADAERDAADAAAGAEDAPATAQAAATAAAAYVEATAAATAESAADYVADTGEAAQGEIDGAPERVDDALVTAEATLQATNDAANGYVDSASAYVAGLQAYADATLPRAGDHVFMGVTIVVNVPAAPSASDVTYAVAGGEVRLDNVRVHMAALPTRDEAAATAPPLTFGVAHPSVPDPEAPDVPDADVPETPDPEAPSVPGVPEVDDNDVPDPSTIDVPDAGVPVPAAPAAPSPARTVIAGVVTLTVGSTDAATEGDAAGVASWTVLWDGAPAPGSALDATTFSLDVRGERAGEHTVTVIAVDRVGNQATTTLVVQVVPTTDAGAAATLDHGVAAGEAAAAEAAAAVPPVEPEEPDMPEPQEPDVPEVEVPEVPA